MRHILGIFINSEVANFTTLKFIVKRDLKQLEVRSWQNMKAVTTLYNGFHKGLKGRYHNAYNLHKRVLELTTEFLNQTN